MKQIHKQLQRLFLKIEKRIRFVISTAIVSAVMLIATFFFFDKSWFFVSLLIVLVYIITYFSLIEGVRKIEWITLFVLPILFTITAYFFYFLFPVRWLTRLPFIVLYSISFYALLLTSNIFNVGVKTNLQLYRAAFSVNYFFQTFICFLGFNILFSLKQGFITNAIFTFILVTILAFHLLWTVKLELFFEKTIIYYTLILALVVTEVALVLSFIPWKNTMVLALFLSSCYYSLVGLVYSYYNQRFFKDSIREYLLVLGFVGVIALLSVGW